ncbi:MAG: 3-isopropylmalate dehydratase small subunit [Actinomycetota bacterium]|nr:3-isopropylmalate dehydratase small subunit [Actinomycetota bacterium]
MIIKGKVWKFGNDIDTDAIIPARYLNTSDPAELAKHVMEDADKTFASRVQKGDIIVAGKNFGCGSSREHAPIAIKASGVQTVIAKSFARIFFRNSFNIGLPIFETADVFDNVAEGETVEVDTGKGVVRTSKGEFQVKPIPPFMNELISAGGLVEWTKKKLAAK